MWLLFVGAVVACVVFLYAPGFLLCRGIGLGSLSALVVAPLASIACYCLACAAYDVLGIYSSWASVFLPIFVAAALVFAIGLTRRRREPLQAQRADWGVLGAYLAVGIVLAIVFLATTFNTPYSVISEYDNAFHLDVIRAFVDSGSWSFFDVSKYLTSVDDAIAPLGEGTFYPAAWHVLCSMVAGISGNSAALAENAVDFVVAGVVFPMGMAYLCASIFTSRRVMYLGAFVTLAFVSYPWVLFFWGPLLPNVLAFALVPAIAGLFIRIVNGMVERWVRACGVIVFFLGFITLALSQPNALFFCVVLLAPYCFYRLWTLPEGIGMPGRVVSGRALALAFGLLVVLVWVALFFAPFMQGLVAEGSWAAEKQPTEATMSIVTLQFGWFAPQYALALLVLVGICLALSRRECRWLVFVYLFFCLGYFLCVATEGLPKHLIGGFWYCDPYRLAACMAMAGVPLAALGLEALACGLDRLAARRIVVRRSCMGLAVVLFCVLNYAPAIPMPSGEILTPLGEYRRLMYEGNGRDVRVHYSSEERDFVERVAELVGPDALVVNLPDDGSAYAYGTDGLRVLFREYRGYVDEGSDEGIETPESRLVRMRLADLEDDEEVRAALRSLGARYVMLLDYGDALGEQHVTPFFEERFWPGILDVDDETPGLELILSEGDMRLYEIALPDERISDEDLE